MSALSRKREMLPSATLWKRAFSVPRSLCGAARLTSRAAHFRPFAPCVACIPAGAFHTAQNLRKSLARYFLVVFIESILFGIDYLFSLLLCLNQAQIRPRKRGEGKPTKSDSIFLLSFVCRCVAVLSTLFRDEFARRARRVNTLCGLSKGQDDVSAQKISSKPCSPARLRGHLLKLRRGSII